MVLSRGMADYPGKKQVTTSKQAVHLDICGGGPQMSMVRPEDLVGFSETTRLNRLYRANPVRLIE
jgi:hypothetical protein